MVSSREESSFLVTCCSLCNLHTCMHVKFALAPSPVSDLWPLPHRPEEVHCTPKTLSIAHSEERSADLHATDASGGEFAQSTCTMHERLATCKPSFAFAFRPHVLPYTPCTFHGRCCTKSSRIAANRKMLRGELPPNASWSQSPYRLMQPPSPPNTHDQPTSPLPSGENVAIDCRRRDGRSRSTDAVALAKSSQPVSMRY